MSVQSFEKSDIENLDYSLKKDVIKNNLVGATYATTMVLCNTRSWHGLLSVYDKNTDANMILLSTLDDSVICDNRTYYLSVRKYPAVFFPLGYQYIQTANFNPITRIEYSIGGRTLRKEMLLATNEETLLIKYTLDSNSPVRIQIRPILAFRSAMSLRRLSRDIEIAGTPIENGIACCPHPDDPVLHLQTNIPCNFVNAPDWNYNIEYPVDQKEGKPYQEDLFMPGFFDVQLEPGTEFILCASTKNQETKDFESFFIAESYTRPRRKTYEDYLLSAAEMMTREVNGECRTIETMPQSSITTKDSFGALPGLMLPSGNYNQFLKIMKSYQKRINNGAFGNNSYAPEAPLWFVWALQQFVYQVGSYKDVYQSFGDTLSHIVTEGMNNHMQGFFVDENGLVSIIRNGERRYYAEINAMWYNTLMFVAELNSFNENIEFSSALNKYARRLRLAFNTRFVSMSVNYLANSIDTADNKDMSCCPGQILAYALPYPIADIEKMEAALQVYENRLLTPVGLRNSCKGDPMYEKNSDITPFYLGFLAEIYLKVYGESGMAKAETLYRSFDTKLNEIQSPCFYEKFSAEPPYEGKGSPLCAVTIAAINRIKMLIDQF